MPVLLLTATSGHIVSRAQQGCDWEAWWQGNTFYSDWPGNGTGNSFYMWQDNGSPTGPPLLTNTGHSIANWSTTFQIVQTTPQLLLGPLKIPAPRWFNRS